MNEYMFIVYVCIVYYVVLLTMLMAVHRVLVLFSAFDDIGGEAVQCSACDDIEAVHVVLVFYSALVLVMILVARRLKQDEGISSQPLPLLYSLLFLSDDTMMMISIIKN